MAEPSGASRERALQDVEHFARTQRAASGLQELKAALADASHRLGFDHFALVHHGPLAQAAAHGLDLDNYPEPWRRQFIDQELHRFDPVQQACRGRLSGFRWSELPTLISIKPRQTKLLVASRRYGLGDGFTVPLHLPGEPAASCSFAMKDSHALPALNLLPAQLLGQFAFEAARRIIAPSRSPKPGLSARQRDCVRLMARGKTDWEIGTILGLSEETVTHYLNAARARYRVARRTQLAVAALFDGEIGFEEVLVL